MRYWKPKRIDPNSKVGISLVTFNQTNCLASLIHALKSQTFSNYRVCTLHDGPWIGDSYRHYLNAVDSDSRFTTLDTPERQAKFGHNLRQKGFDNAIENGCNWICTMNADCWYAPVYLEWMLGSACENKANFVYCNLVHSHKLWKPMKSELSRGAIDAGNWIAHTSLVGDTKWESSNFAADWEYVNKLKAKSNFKPAKVDGYIFTHN